MAQGVLIYGEISRGGLTALTKEVLSIGKTLSEQLGCELTALFIGEGVSETAGEAACFGAERVYVLDHSGIQPYHIDLSVATLEELCKEINPEILLLGQNLSGADLAARMAFRLGVGLTTDCVSLTIDPETGRLLQTKPIYGGNVLAAFSSESGIQIATIRQKAFSTAERDEGKKCEIEFVEPEIDASMHKIGIVKEVEEDFPGIKLEDAEVIVCGGRGMGDAEAFAQLDDLAGMLGGAVAGTRPTCEKGWVHPRLQVGLTGEKVAPGLYIAVGVSGAVQHVAGIIGSKIIVAINKAPEANIFKEADFGAIGDYREILPSFFEEIRKHLSKE